MPDTIVMDTVYFYKFNNYYNRIIKRYDTIEEYGEPLGTQANCNFIQGDGINSSFTFNKGAALKDTPDYVIVKDRDNKISRWYVTNSFKSRGQQDKLQLRRDLIADFYEDVIKYSPCLIRKGWVPQTSPFIFNDEGVRYNKIKREEKLFKDETNCSYIVGFIANNTPAVASVTGTIKDSNYDYSYADLNSFPYKNYVEGAGNTHSEEAKIAYNNNVEGRVFYALKNSGRRQVSSSQCWNAEMFFNKFGLSLPGSVTPLYSNAFDKTYYENSSTMANDVTLISDADVDTPAGYTADRNQALTNYYELMKNGINYSNSTLISDVKSIYQLTEYTYDELSAYDGKRIKIGNNVYTCTLVKEAPVTTEKNSNNFPSAIWTEVIGLFNTYSPTEYRLNSSVNYPKELGYYNANRLYSTDDIRLFMATQQVYLQFAEASSEIKTSIDSPSNRTHLSEQPFDMFVLINEDNVNYKVGVNSYVSNHEVNINIAQAICQASGTSAYDIQIVPFNPIRGSIMANGSINWLNYNSYEIKDTQDNVVGHYVMCSSADIKFTLNKDELKFNPSDYKLDYNTKQYRLCSPNQETIFEFSPSMNGGIDTWEVTANYRPYASYIKIQPTWKSLYGEDLYNNLTDFRGLLYNSSLCVTQLSEAWANYVSQNKNYQQLFDNQINTLTKSNQIQINALEETLGWRSFTGMPIGSIGRVIGGMKDIDMQKELNNVAISKMESDFKYQLDNIQSMPNTIKKLTNINGDTRIFPYIEVFSCTTEEENSFKLKMQYTGYTIMTTGYCWNYLQEGEETFIQADLIRLDLSRSEETADNHLAVEIASELEKGVYLTKEE